MQITNRALTGVIFVVCSAICSFALGMWLGGMYWLPDNSGMAGPVIVLAYGVATAVVVALITTLLAFKLPLQVLFFVNIPLVIGALGVCFTLARVLSESRQQSDRHLQQAYANMLPFTANLQWHGSDPQRIFIDGEQRYYTIADNQQLCRVGIEGEQAAKLLQALRGATIVLYKNASPCAAFDDAVISELELMIEEALPPVTRNQTTITAACLQQHPELEAPFTAIKKIDKMRRLERQCQSID